MALEPERPATQGYYPHVMAGEEVPSVSGEPPPRKRRRRRRRPKPAAAAGAGSGTSSGTPANQRAASKGGAAKKTKASGASKKKASAKRPRRHIPTQREVSAGGVVYRREGDGIEIVLASRRTRRGDLAWGLAKGGIEPGESREDAAVREVREETGLDATIERALKRAAYRGEREVLVRAADLLQ